MEEVKWSVCRICLLEHVDDTMRSILEIDKFSDMQVYEKISICGGIYLVKSDSFPRKICKNCTAFMNVSYKFRLLCKKSEEYFSKLAENTEDDVKSDLNEGIVEIEENYDYKSDYIESEEEEENQELTIDEEETTEAPESTFGVGKKQLPILYRDLTTKKSYICDICGNHYDRKYAFTSHMRRHYNEKPHECEICKKKFATSSELIVHMRRHTGEKPFECSFCNRKFGDRSSKIRHERIHKNERPYICPDCGKSFTYSTSLKKHKLTHTGEKLFRCEPCNKDFAQAHHLKAHLGTISHQTAEKQFIPSAVVYEECFETE